MGGFAREAIELRDAGGSLRLQYGKLLVKDSRDEPVPALIEANGGAIRIVIKDGNGAGCTDIILAGAQGYNHGQPLSWQ